MRQGVAVLWECMIAEMRAVQADLAARAPFTEEGKTIHDTRAALAELLDPVPERPKLHSVQSSAAAMAAATQGGFIEVG